MSQKTVAAVHDLSGLGKCSLTAAIPILSAAGISVGVLPTAVLSTQTGGLNEYTYRDLTADLYPVMNHWKKLNVKFDAVYSGFLGSEEQVDIVGNFVDDFLKKDGLFLCDPAMGDNGSLYNTFNADFVVQMKKLCSKADIIVPNLTEACMLLNGEYDIESCSFAQTEEILRNLASEFGVKYIVLTGVSLKSSEIGVAAFDVRNSKTFFVSRPKTEGMFHSTGDVFASALLGAVLNGFTIDKSCEIAIDFTVRAINETVIQNGDSRFGLCFEKCLPDFIKSLELI